MQSHLTTANYKRLLLRGPTHEIPVPVVLGMRGDASELGSKDAGGGLGDMVTGALSKLGVLPTHSHIVSSLFDNGRAERGSCLLEGAGAPPGAIATSTISRATTAACAMDPLGENTHARWHQMMRA